MLCRIYQTQQPGRIVFFPGNHVVRQQGATLCGWMEVHAAILFIGIIQGEPELRGDGWD